MSMTRRPICNVLSSTSNIFYIVGAAAKVLIKAGLSEDQVIEMKDKVSQAEDYDEALLVIDEYVDLY